MQKTISIIKKNPAFKIINQRIFHNKTVSEYIEIISAAFSGILFMNNSWVKFLILGSLFLDLNIMLSSIIAFLVLVLFVKVANLDKKLLKNSYFIYNSLLVGIAVGNIFELSIYTVFFIGASSLLTFLLTVCLNRWLSTYQLPVLSIPFALVSCCIYLAAGKYSNLFSLDYYQRDPLPQLTEALPVWLVTFFNNLGSIFFMPYAITGMIIFIAIIIYSRILAFQAFSGFYLGIFLHSLLVNSIDHSLINPYNFNYILVSMALGGIFMVATHRTLIITLLAISVCVLLIDMTSSFVNLYHIPIFTIPFNITVVLFVMSMKLLNYMDFNTQLCRTPESSLLYHLISAKRFKNREVSLALPLAEKSKIFQGFDGKWTHKDDWKYAYDFVQVDNTGTMFKGSGEKLEDYYIYGKDILAPTSGYVISCKDDLKDNKPGIFDPTNNWGNYIIIKVSDTVFVEISHLKNNSLTVKTGDYIYCGQAIAKCGNNGYSLFPHLHIHVQNSGQLGAQTIPFNFSTYKQEDKVKLFSQPQKDNIISPVKPDYEFANRWQLPPESTLHFTIKQNKQTDRHKVQVIREADIYGKTFLEDSNGSKLYFTQNYGAFYFYDFVGDESSILKKLYLTLPHLPLCKELQYSWEAAVPANIPYTGLKAHLQPICYFFGTQSTIKGEWRFNQRSNKVTGKINLSNKTIATTLRLDPVCGWQELIIEETNHPLCNTSTQAASNRQPITTNNSGGLK